MLSSSDFLGHHFIHHATKQGNTKAIADASTRYTYAQLLDEITHMAGHLKGLGLKKGDRAIVALGNTTQHVIAHFGILFAGGISVPLPHDLGTNRLAFYIKDTQAALIISRDGIFDNTQTKRSPFQDYRQANSTISPAKKEDLACIMYTTGSTNHPKGVMLTHQTLLAALSHIMHYVPYQEINRELILLPISHSFGLGHLYCATIAGGFAFIEEGLQKMKRVFNTLETEKISCMPATPPICSMFLGRYRDFFLKKARFLQRMVVNSAPLPPEITKKMLDALPHLRLLVYYGLTEASRSTFITLSDEPESRYNSVGKPSQHVTIKLIENEVCISGPHLFSGYWNLPDETAQSLQKDWLHTGDLGKIDKDGYLRITGRIKDLINIGGAKVSGQEVDYVLKKHPLVKDAVSVGIKDPEELRGEVVGTLVVSNTPIQDQNKLTQSLREFCSDYLEAHMIPEKIIYSDHIPLTENGKINKRNIISCLS